MPVSFIPRWVQRASCAVERGVKVQKTISRRGERAAVGKGSSRGCVCYSMLVGTRLNKLRSAVYYGELPRRNQAARRTRRLHAASDVLKSYNSIHLISPLSLSPPCTALDRRKKSRPRRRRSDDASRTSRQTSSATSFRSREKLWTSYPSCDSPLPTSSSRTS